MLEAKNSLLKRKSGPMSKFGPVLLVIILISVITAIFEPIFLAPSNWVSLLVNNNNVFLTAFGMTFVLLAGGIDLSVGSLAALSGMFAAKLLTMGVGAIPTIIITLVVGYALGMLSGFIISKTDIPPFVMTLGTMTIYRGLAVALNSGYPLPIAMTNSFTILGSGYLFGVIPMPIVITVITFIFSAIILKKTNIGRNVYAIGGNPEAARISGISVLRTNLFAYGMCAMFAALTGMILSARMYTGLPSSSEGLETNAIAAVVLGGTSFTGGDGDVLGTILGVLLLAILLNGMVLLGFPAWLQSVVQGIIIILAVIYDKSRKSRL